MMVLRFVENPVTIRTEPLRLATNHVRTTGNMMARASRRIAPVDRSPYRKNKGPHLNRSISSDLTILSITRVQAEVGSDLDWALVAHEGARPHPILPRRPGGRLRFYWERQGRWVSLPRVSHPGMEGVKYLTIPLVAIGTARGYRVVLL